MLDTGKPEINNSPNCSAKLLVFDLTSDRLIFKIIIPDAISQNGLRKGLMANLVVETNGHYCEDTTVRNKIIIN